MNALKLRKIFDDEISGSVYALSKTPKPTNNNPEKAEIRFNFYIRCFINFSKKSPIPIYVKIADQIHNMSNMQAFSWKKKERKLMEAKESFLPFYENIASIPKSDIKKYKNLLSTLKSVFYHERMHLILKDICTIDNQYPNNPTIKKIYKNMREIQSIEDLSFFF